MSKELRGRLSSDLNRALPIDRPQSAQGGPKSVGARGKLSKLLAGSLSVERASWKAVWERAGRKFELTSSCSNSFHASACLRETESESAFFPSDSFYITIYKSAFLLLPLALSLRRSQRNRHIDTAWNEIESLLFPWVVWHPCTFRCVPI